MDPPPPCARIGQEAFMRTCEPCSAVSKTDPESFAWVAREVLGDSPLQENTELRGADGKRRFGHAAGTTAGCEPQKRITQLALLR